MFSEGLVVDCDKLMGKIGVIEPITCEWLFSDYIKLFYIFLNRDGGRLRHVMAKIWNICVINAGLRAI